MNRGKLGKIGRRTPKTSRYVTGRNRKYFEDRLDNHYVSAKSDNRVFCPLIGRQKFRYETKEKAELACKYSKNKQRAYYCKACCAWHTTSMSKGKFYSQQAYSQQVNVYAEYDDD